LFLINCHSPLAPNDAIANSNSEKITGGDKYRWFKPGVLIEKGERKGAGKNPDRS